MLRSTTSRLRESVSNQYVCWQCLSKVQPWISSATVQHGNATRSSSGDVRLRLGRRQFHAGRSIRAAVESANGLPQDPPPFGSNIRERLKQWELENAGDLSIPHMMTDIRPSNDILNSATRPSSSDFWVDRDQEQLREEEQEGDSMLAFEHDLVDVGQRRNFLLPGDMVEVLSAGNQTRELAIFIQDFTKQAQFYTMTGRWLHKGADIIKFMVPNFVEGKELEEIKPWLPTEDLTEDMVDRLQSFDNSQVPRNVGKPLIQKMLAFWEQADNAYQSAAVEMDNAHSLVAHPTKFTYASLHQIADKLLGDKLPKMEDGKFPFHVLYALHRTIMQDGIGFHPSARQVMRGEGDYEINSLREVKALQRITEKIRSALQARISIRRGANASDIPSTMQLDRFVKKARSLIDGSRKLRDFTECGVLGPSKLVGGKDSREGTVVSTFTDADRDFIYFLESWACLRSFSSSSALNGIGSSILRSIGRYRDVPLNRTTAFTCLMELGVIPPWETQSSFELRLPYTSQRFSSGFNGTNGLVPDQMADLRKNWGQLQVYCIDDASASEIDDGVSVETTENPEEYWIHVHIADPAAHINHDSEVAKYAQLLSSSVYMPDRTVHMLLPDWVKARVSLGPGKPCLTHSIKLNLAGEALEFNITPGVINNVAYLTGDTLNEAVSESRRAQLIHTMVGEHKLKEQVSRPILQSQDLSVEQIDDLKLLHRLTAAKRKIRAKKGSLSAYPKMVEVSTSFGGAPWVKPAGLGARYHGDPAIRLTIPHVNDQGIDLSQLGVGETVSTLMLLAGEAAAYWCHARGIPVIYRISPFNPDKDNPLEYYNKYVLPSYNEQGFAKLEVSMQYLRLVGKTQPSTVPGPHLGVGVDKIIQTTSPIRRFGDMLNHWQINAALREEARTGESLIGNTKDDFLPYSAAQVDALLPRLAEREKFVRQGQNKAVREWTLRYLVRAWKFNEAQLASPLLFYVRSINPQLRTVGGVLPSLLVGGVMVIPDDIKADEIQVGDTFEVQINHIDIYERLLDLGYIRRVPISEVEELDSSLASMLRTTSPKSLK